MPGRHRPVALPAAPSPGGHPGGRRLAGAGAAGLAVVFAAVPFAHAEGTGQPAAAPTAASAAPHGALPHGAAQPRSAKPAATTQSTTPDYGLQKVRVGVQIKSGAYVPAGTGTAGTTLQLTETGPNAGEQADAVRPAATGGGTTCTTAADTLQAGSTATYCEFEGAPPAAVAGLHPQQPGPSNQYYLVAPGDTLTVTQLTVNANLVIDSSTQTFAPCPAVDGPFCADSATALFTDAGLPPQAGNDQATLAAGTSVLIDVLARDDTHGAPATITVASAPGHGTATVVSGGAPSGRGTAPAATGAGAQIRYTAKAGYAGPDAFTYTVHTANGAATATVRLTVTPAAPIAKDDTAHTTSGAPVTISVLSNDSANGGADLRITAVGTPAHGAARISGQRVVYTPSASFVGTDTFRYTITTTGGTASGTVTVTVGAATSTPIANTGSPDRELLELGGGLLLVGGLAAEAGRRRYRARHVRG